MNQVEIIFDNRERFLIDVFKNKFPSIAYSVEAINIGDIQFKLNGNLCCLVERKTLDDLSASIMDHRLQEQKKRMLELQYCKKVYIIEGLNKTNQKGIPYDTLISSMWSTIIRDDIYVFRTCNIQETALSIKLIYEKLLKQNHEKIESPIINQISGNKKSLYTKENIWTAQVACIPGLSFNLAKKITTEYNSFEELYNTYINKDRDISFLCKIPKIGKKLSNTLAEYLF